MQIINTEDGFSEKKVKQFFVILFISSIVFLLATQLMFILSAFFGALTLYILMRKPHKHLMRKYQWKSGSASIVLLISSIILLLIPLYLTIQFVIIKISPFVSNYQPLIDNINTINTYINNRFDFILLSSENLNKVKTLIGKLISSIIGSGMLILTDLVLMYFLLWYMLKNSFRIERWLKMNSPFNRNNTKLLMDETKKTVTNNAIGIVILGLVQGIVAIIGYMIFGIKEPVLWGLITGFASVIPFAGTMVIWIPLTILLFAHGDNMAGIGLGLWGLLLIGSIDNVLRFLLQKRMSQTHPIITVFGVIIGLNLFGFWGLIFGPLLFVLLLILGKIYKNEYLSSGKTNNNKGKLIQ